MRKTFVFLIIVLLIGMMPAAAQDDDNNPFMQMLARVPNTESARSWLTYVDYRAQVAARRGAFPVKSWLEFEAANNIGGSGAHEFMQALMGIRSGPGFFTQIFASGGDMEEAVGFDPFMVERGVEYGLPPAAVVIVEGDFTAEAVINAHTARNYSASESGDLTLLCGADGCDSGMNVNIRDRDPANPFGGELGRSQPVLVADRLAASSPSIDALDQTASTINGEEDSILSDPDYAAAAEALGTVGTTLQAYFINPGDILPLSEALLSSVSDPAAVKAQRAELAQTFVPLPPYRLIAIGDAATDTDQIALLALVYADQADAEAAAAQFPAKLTDFQSFAIRRTYGEILVDRGVTSIAASVYSASSGRSVMLLTLRAPQPDTDTTSSMIYGLLAQAYIRRDLAWLATAF